MEQENNKSQETINLELLEQALDLDSNEDLDSFMLVPDKVC